jgi:hypothetical protein
MSTTTFSAGSIPRRADNVEISPRISEDWLSLIIGLLIFALALAGIANVDLLGWAVTTSVWTDIGKALGPVSKAYASLGGAGSLLATYVQIRRGQGRNDGSQFYVRYCFADPAHADAFRDRFGGERLTGRQVAASDKR